MTPRALIHPLLLALTLALLSTACMGANSQHSPAVKLDKAMRGFHGNLVWQRFDEAAAYVPTRQRLAFLDYYQSQVGEFYITEYEVNSVEISPDKTIARCAVMLSWYRLPSMSVQTTLMEETWNFIEEEQRWELTRQEATPGPAAMAR